MNPGALEAWESLVVGFHRVWTLVETDVERQGAEIPLHWYDVLLVLHRAPGHRLRFAEVAERIVTSRAAFSRSMAKMEAAGLVRREPCREDARGQWAILTDEGEGAFKRTWPLYKRAIERHFAARLDADAARALAALMGRFGAPASDDEAD